jgi:nucleoside-diphosphate-sugar epimerase
MGNLRVLFIGGSGVISSACSQVAVNNGIELFVLNRGRSTSRPLPPGVTMLRGDIREPWSVRDEIKDLEFDAVADWVAFTPEHVRTDIELFGGRTGQYVFISSASAYQTPPARVPVTESTPLRNPYSQYSRDKIACEDLLVAAYREQGFPATIVPHLEPDRGGPRGGAGRNGAPAARAVGRDRGRPPGLGRGAAG